MKGIIDDEGHTAEDEDLEWSTAKGLMFPQSDWRTRPTLIATKKQYEELVYAIALGHTWRFLAGVVCGVGITISVWSLLG